MTKKKTSDVVYVNGEPLTPSKKVKLLDHLTNEQIVKLVGERRKLVKNQRLANEND